MSPTDPQAAITTLRAIARPTVAFDDVLILNMGATERAACLVGS